MLDNSGEEKVLLEASLLTQSPSLSFREVALVVGWRQWTTSAPLALAPEAIAPSVDLSRPAPGPV